MTHLQTRAAERFAATYRRAPIGIWSAPGRVNLIGEHTDYNEGYVLPFAIDRRTLVALAPRDDATLRVASSFTDEPVSIDLDELTPDRLGGWAAYPLGVAWALGQHGANLKVLHGVDLSLESTVPVGAGLSSSAAIECAVAIALNEVWHLGLGRSTLAQVGQLAENTAVGAPTGIMDQSACLLGRADHAVFLDCRSLRFELIELGFEKAGLELLVIDTGVAHSHADNGYAQRRAQCTAGAVALGVASLRDLTAEDLPRAKSTLDDETFRRVRHVITENQRVLDTVATLHSEGPLAIGELLQASHVSLRNDFEVSAPELDLAVDIALASGAIGARMTGGGFGGAAIALAPIDAIPGTRRAIEAAFTDRGFSEPTTFTVTVADGASRDR